MARPRRIDFPGAFFHVTNRALSGRRLAEDARDARHLLSRVARVVRAGLIDVHGFSVRPDAYDLVVTSRAGRLAEAMRWVQDLHARAWNRRRASTGPLFRARYRAKLLPSRTHRLGVLDYVDHAAVRLGLVTRPDAWPFSSAAAPRPWLTDDLRAARARADPTTPVVAWDLVARWLRHRETGPHDLDRLITARESALASWLARRAAPSTVTGLVLVRPRVLVAALEAAPDADDVLAAGLLRMVSGLTLLQIADRHDVAKATAHARVHACRRRLREGPTRPAGRVLHRALAVEYGRVRGMLQPPRAHEAVG